MMSSTSADVNANVNQMNADVIQVKLELLSKFDVPRLCYSLLTGESAAM